MSSLFKHTCFSKKFRRVAARASVGWIFAGETAWGTCGTLSFSVLEVIAISTLGNTFSCRVWSCTSYTCIFIMTAWMVTPTIMCASFQSLLFSGAFELEKKKMKHNITPSIIISHFLVTNYFGKTNGQNQPDQTRKTGSSGKHPEAGAKDLRSFPQPYAFWTSH